MRSRRGTRVGVAALLLLGVAVMTRAEASAQVAFTDAGGIHVMSANQIDSRQYNVSVATDALGRPVDVRILLPDGYETSTAPLPVLYLFHGTSGRASDWVEHGEAEQATAGRPLIVVMPDAGFDRNGGGWFTNWVDTSTSLGPSRWETFHVDDLIPWVDANLRTVKSRAGRAVAGLSQGGFGSMTYAARHPDLFVSAASFSGAPDIDYNPTVAAGATAVIQATAVFLDGVQPDAMFGSRATNEINWQGHDPADLVTNLRDVDLWLYTATGAPGEYDSGTPDLGASGIEWATHESTMSFVQRAQQLGVAYHLDDYTYGTHTWPYWVRDLRAYLPALVETFAHPPAVPASVSYESIDQNWTQWDWSVSLQRGAPQQFSSLTNASATGFTLRGTGTASVTTPAFYPPGAAATITMSGGGMATATADSSGRLHVAVPLGLDVPTAAVVGVPTETGSANTVTITVH